MYIILIKLLHKTKELISNMLKLNITINELQINEILIDIHV